MAQKPNLHGLQNYSLRSGKYAIAPTKKDHTVDTPTPNQRNQNTIDNLRSLGELF